jgi:hypothetical protein
MSGHSDAVQTVLEEFFMFDIANDCWFHKRCDETISAYQAKAERNRAVGKLGGRPKSNPDAIPQETQMVSKDNPNHKPITNNHKPIEKKTLGKRLANDLVLSDEWKDFCVNERPELNPVQTFDKFKDYWIAQAGQKGVKLDWFATWRNWVRNTNAPKQNPADIVRLTVPSKNEPDPALEKIKQDEKVTRPPTPEERAILNAYRRKA